MRKFAKILGGAAVLAALPSLGWAEDPTITEVLAAEGNEGIYFVFNTLLFLIGGFLVMWMAAGFAMLEAGFVRTKNVSMQCLKNISLYSVAGIMFYVVGYQLMYNVAEAGAGFFGTPGIMDFGTATLDSVKETLADDGDPYSGYSDWFFQMVFCATTASIVSGTLAERIKFWPFMIFVVLLTGFIYPIVGSWEWGTGWLDRLGFSDFAGSTLVHSTGGWAALVGAVILGARKGKYVDGKVNPIPGSNMPLATLGVFILWLGWFGFNGASQLAMGTIEDGEAIAKVFVNTNMAAAAGVVAAVIYLAMLIGAIGSILACLTVPLLDKFKIDDVVGAIPVHLVAGIFGTLAVAFTSPSLFVPQLIGVVSVGLFVSIVSAIVWFALKKTIGLRVSEEDEYIGLDQAEVGVPSYPEFVQG